MEKTDRETGEGLKTCEGRNIQCDGCNFAFLTQSSPFSRGPSVADKSQTWYLIWLKQLQVEKRCKVTKPTSINAIQKEDCGANEIKMHCKT